MHNLHKLVEKFSKVAQQISEGTVGAYQDAINEILKMSGDDPNRAPTQGTPFYNDLVSTWQKFPGDVQISLKVSAPGNVVDFIGVTNNQATSKMVGMLQSKYKPAIQGLLSAKIKAGKIVKSDGFVWSSVVSLSSD